MNGFCQRSNLIHFDQNAVCDPFIDAALQTSRVGHKQVVTNQLHSIATLVGQHLPCVPIVFATSVLDAADWVAINPIRQEINHASRIKAFAVNLVDAIFIKFSGSDIQRDLNLLARLIARFLDRGHDHAERFFVATKVRSKTTFVTHGGVHAFFLKHFLQIVEDLATTTHGITKSLEAQRHHHELLDINIVVSVFATVDDIHHWSRQQIPSSSAKVTVQWLVTVNSSCFGRRQRNSQQRVRAQILFVFGAIKIQHRLINQRLIGPRHAQQSVC